MFVVWSAYAALSYLYCLQDEEMDISPVDMDDALVIEEEDISDDDDDDDEEDVSIPSPVCTLQTQLFLLLTTWKMILLAIMLASFPYS